MLPSIVLNYTHTIISLHIFLHIVVWVQYVKTCKSNKQSQLFRECKLFFKLLARHAYNKNTVLDDLGSCSMSHGIDEFDKVVILEIERFLSQTKFIGCISYGFCIDWF